MTTSNFSATEWRIVSAMEREICGSHMREIPVRMSRLASDLGVRVHSATLPSGISGELRPCDESPSGFKIRVNRHENKKRQRFTVAHELGHFLLHKDLVADGIVDNVLYRSTLSNKIEAQANRVAADLLMPRLTISNWLLANFDDEPEENDLDYISQEWKVSKVAVKIRLDI